MKKLFLVTMLLTSFQVSAYEQFRASDGTQCRSDRDTRSELSLSTYSTENGNAGVRAEITIKIGEMHRPLNCKKLEELEVDRLKTELALLKQQLNEQNTWN